MVRLLIYRQHTSAYVSIRQKYAEDYFVRLLIQLLTLYG